MNRSLWLALVFAVGGCEIFTDPPVCTTEKSSVFVTAWEEQLTEKSTPYSKKNENTLCFQKEHSFDGHKVRLLAEQVYRGAAMFAETIEESRQLFEYIRREKREYEEMPVQYSRNEKSEHEEVAKNEKRTLVVVFSESRAQLEETQVMFSCIKQGSNCLE